MAVQSVTHTWTALGTDAGARVVNIVRGDVWVYPAATVTGNAPINQGWKLRGPILIPAGANISFRGPGDIDVLAYYDERPQADTSE